MSVTNSTAKHLILDAGAVYINYGENDERLLGATRGGSTFLVEREIREIEADGLKGKWKGGRRIINENASLTVNLLELNADNIRLALAGSVSEDYPDTQDKTHERIVSTGTIGSADYLKNVALVAKVSGSEEPVVILLHNALADGELSLALTDKEEAAVEVVFSAHYDPADLEAAIYEIRYPVVA